MAGMLLLTTSPKVRRSRVEAMDRKYGGRSSNSILISYFGKSGRYIDGVTSDVLDVDIPECQNTSERLKFFSSE